MKKIIFIFTILIASIFSTNAIAATATPTHSASSGSATSEPVPSTCDQKCQDLQSQLASEAAHMNISNRKGFIGIVNDTTNTQITITDRSGNTQVIRVDELTKFSSPGNSDSFGISDITKGSTIGILGLYYKDTQITIARFINVLTLSQFLHGTITSVDSKKFNFTIATENNANTLIDVETPTKIMQYTKADGLVKAGFSKLTVGENVIITGFPDVKNKSMIVASRLTLFPELQSNPNIHVNIPTPSATPTATTTPTSKPSPTK